MKAIRRSPDTTPEGVVIVCVVMLEEVTEVAVDSTTGKDIGYGCTISALRLMLAVPRTGS